MSSHGHTGIGQKLRYGTLSRKTAVSKRQKKKDLNHFWNFTTITMYHVFVKRNICYYIWATIKCFWQEFFLFMCFLKVSYRLNFVSQLEQVNGRSSVWVGKWFFTCSFVMNLMLQWGQPNGLSPVWIFSCLCIFAAWRNFFWQYEQLNGLSPVWWILTCSFTLFSCLPL